MNDISLTRSTYFNASVSLSLALSILAAREKFDRPKIVAGYPAPTNGPQRGHKSKACWIMQDTVG